MYKTIKTDSEKRLETIGKAWKERDETIRQYVAFFGGNVSDDTMSDDEHEIYTIIGGISGRWFKYRREILTIAAVVMDYKGFDFAHAVRATIWQIRHTIAHGKTGNVRDAIDYVSQWADNHCNSDYGVYQCGKRGEQKTRIRRNVAYDDGLDEVIASPDNFTASALLRLQVITIRRKLDDRTRARLDTLFSERKKGGQTIGTLFDSMTGEILPEAYDAKTRKMASRLALTVAAIMDLDSVPNAQDLLRALYMFWND